LPFDANFIQRIPVDNLMNEACYLPIIKKLVFEQKVNAILTCNDEMAAMVIRVLLKMNVKIPENISVIGYDNVDFARLENGIKQVANKGANNSLVMIDNNAYIVNVKNRTIVTAVDQQSLKNNVFTNIDSVAIV